MSSNLPMAEVAIPRRLDKILRYSIPERFIGRLSPGMRLLVPLGRSKITGYLVGLSGGKGETEKLKEIIDILDDIPAINKEILDLTRWASEYYMQPLGLMIKAAIPGGMDLKRGSKRLRVKEGLSILQLPEIKGEEADLINEIKGCLAGGIYSPYLLAGSDKAIRERIYLHLISACLDKGRAALLLVPEISPNLGLIKRLEGIFGGRIALFHSGISEGKKLDIFSRIRMGSTGSPQGKIDIIVGARSAIFAPVDSPGIIIIEDEEDPSYKQDKGVRYNARRLALKRGERLNIPVIMGSSSPSVEGFYYGMTGVYRLRILDNHGSTGSPPDVADVRIVDMRGIKGGYILSDHLKSSIANRLARRERILLFINKRGFSNSIICQECGYYFRCSGCALSMTYHKEERRLLCHHCNRSLNVPEICPECRSYRLMEVGIGTERVEEEVKKIFPNARIARLDKDTIKGRDANLTNGEIIIGTDLVLRRPDIPEVSLIGIVLADTGLYLPDFQSSHRTYKLLQRLIGLAGKGEVIIQTNNPSHHAIGAVADRSSRFDRFYMEEIEYRKRSGYPPFSSMITITIEGGNIDRCRERTLKLAEIIRGFLRNRTELLGPTRGYPEMIKGRYRWQMILKGDGPVQDIVKRSIDRLEGEVSTSGIRIDLDMDP